MFCEDQLEKVCMNAGSCDEFIDLHFESPITDFVNVVFDFNGRRHKHRISVTAGQNILIENLFSDNYTHHVKLIDSNGNVVGNRKYVIQINPCFKN